MPYKGTFKITKPEKYNGDPNKVIFRSLWERNAFRWCEASDKVVRWNSEDVVIPYICETDKKPHRYHIDLCIEWADGTTVLVEIKPASQTKPPKTPKRKTKNYIAECMAYAKNESKWKAANQFAKKHNVKFQVWTEATLRSYGIKILK